MLQENNNDFVNNCVMKKNLHYSLERLSVLQAVQTAETVISSYPEKYKETVGREQI